MHALRTLVVGLALLSLVGIAEAQGRGGRGGGNWGRGVSRFLAQPEYLRRDLPIFVDELRLDQTQKVIVETLLMDYQESFEEAYAVVRAEIEALQPQRTTEEEELRRSQWQEIGELRSEMREVRDTIEELGDREDVDPRVVQRLEQRLEGLDVEMSERRSDMFDMDAWMARQEATSSINDDWSKRRRTLGVEFMISVQALLNDEQVQRWPSFERSLRRIKTMQYGRISGESVDLFILIKQLAVQVQSVPDLAESLEAYAYSLDAALAARNAHLEEHRETASRAARSGDARQAESVSSREADLRVRVRDVNQEHAGIIASVLGADAEGAEFANEFNMRAFPRIYRPTRMQRAFEAAMKLEGLTAEIMEAVTNLEQAYMLELGIVNDKIVTVTRKQEPKAQVDRVRRQAERAASGERGWGRRGRGGDDGDEDPIRAAYREREELDYRYWQQLEAILTPEQIAQLPEVSEPGQRRRGGRGSFEERLAEVDANGDGKLQRAEAPEWMQGFFDRLDTNGDGTVDQKEMEEMRNRFRGGRGGDGGGRGGRGGDGGGRGGRGGDGGGRGGRGGDGGGRGGGRGADA